MSITKKKRVSKKNKVAWRKHVNIEDVEDFLEEQRQDERLGNLEDKPNDELFEVDVKPNDKKIISKKEARELLRQKQPRCFTMLQPLTQVPDPIKKRNRVRTKEERKNELVKKKEQGRKEAGILRKRELQAYIDRRLYDKKRLEKTNKKVFQADIWNTTECAEIVNNEWIGDASKVHILHTMSKHERNVPKSLQTKHSFLPSIEAPHPGTSYNPTLADHRDLLHKVADKERAIIKQEEHIQRVTSKLFKKVSPQVRDELRLKELMQGLEDKTPDYVEGDYSTVNPPAENKKKTLKQRRKQKEQLQMILARNIAKREKKKGTDLRELRLVKAKLDEEAKRLEEEKVKRTQKAAAQPEVPKKLGPVKYEEEEIEFNFPQDISGSLRNMKKEGNLLLDRFKSLQKRNILQPSIRRNRKVAKVKRFKRSDYKDNWKVTVARSKDTSL